jgi:hypothetical protein
VDAECRTCAFKDLLLPILHERPFLPCQGWDTVPQRHSPQVTLLTGRTCYADVRKQLDPSCLTSAPPGFQHHVLCIFRGITAWTTSPAVCTLAVCVCVTLANPCCPTCVGISTMPLMVQYPAGHGLCFCPCADAFLVAVAQLVQPPASRCCFSTCCEGCRLGHLKLAAIKFKSCRKLFPRCKLGMSRKRRGRQVEFRNISSRRVCQPVRRGPSLICPEPRAAREREGEQGNSKHKHPSPLRTSRWICRK